MGLGGANVQLGRVRPSLNIFSAGTPNCRDLQAVAMPPYHDEGIALAKGYGAKPHYYSRTFGGMYGG